MPTSSRPEAEPDATPIPILGLSVRGFYRDTNRRLSPRVHVSFRVQAAGMQASWHGANLSLGGALCVADDLMWPGNAVALSLDLPDAPGPLHVQGRVVDLIPVHGRVGMRIRFEQMDHAQRERLATWIASQRKV